MIIDIYRNSPRYLDFHVSFLKFLSCQTAKLSPACEGL